MFFSPILPDVSRNFASCPFPAYCADRVNFNLTLQVAAKSFDIVYQSSNADEIMVAESLRIPYLKLALELATELGQDKRTYVRQLSELRYAGVRLENASSLLEVIRDRYIHRASHTSKIS